MPFIIIPALLGGIIALGGWLIPASPILALACFSAWFFRDPRRTIEGDDRAVLSPADGVVINIEEIEDTRFLNANALKISIFMSLFNVHVNRVPLSGVVEDIRYFPGRFFSAGRDKASQENEHNAVVMRVRNQHRIAFVQIAGLIARRIACWVSPGDEIVRGQRFGLIRFGSRLEVYLPPSTEIKIKLKQKVRAGHTILGNLP